MTSLEVANAVCDPADAFKAARNSKAADVPPKTGSTASGEQEDLDFDIETFDSDSEASSSTDEEEVAQEVDADEVGSDVVAGSTKRARENDEDVKEPVAKRSRPQKNETLIIFDWDDTLFPSSWLVQQGLKLGEASQPNKEQWQQLKEIAFASANSLREARKYGRVVVVTNAERGWVDQSCKKFCPWLWPSMDNITVVCARPEYEPRGFPSPYQWKYLAFQNEINNWHAVEPNDLTNILSLGDAPVERLALLKATEGMPGVLGKSIKFVEKPNVKHLIEQHELIGNCLRYLARHDGSLDLCTTFPKMTKH